MSYVYFTELKEMVLADNFCAINSSSDTSLTNAFDCCINYEISLLTDLIHNNYMDIIKLDTEFKLSEFRSKIDTMEDLKNMSYCLYHLVGYIDSKHKIISESNSYQSNTFLFCINIALNKIIKILC